MWTFGQVGCAGCSPGRLTARFFTRFCSQGRDLKLCLWDLAEGRNTVVDSVGLESVGFCKGSVLARGPQHWMLAVPGSGSDEVSTSPCSRVPGGSVSPMWVHPLLAPGWGNAGLAPGPRGAVGQVWVCLLDSSSRTWGWAFAWSPVRWPWQ